MTEPDRIVAITPAMYEQGFDAEVLSETPSGELVVRLTPKAEPPTEDEPDRQAYSPEAA